MHTQILLLLLLLCGCTKNYTAIHKDDCIPDLGIRAWHVPVRFVEITDPTCFDKPDLYIHKVDHLPDGWGAVYIPIRNYDAYKKAGLDVPSYKQDCILVRLNYPAMVAHEFGHYLGHEHSKDTNSIMYPEVEDRPLNTFNEFK